MKRLTTGDPGQVIGAAPGKQYTPKQEILFIYTAVTWNKIPKKRGDNFTFLTNLYRLVAAQFLHIISLSKGSEYLHQPNGEIEAE